MGISYSQFIDFCIIGVIANISIGLFARLIAATKFVKLTDEEKTLYVDFVGRRSAYIKENNSAYKIILNFLSFMIPTYTAWLNVVFLWNLYQNKNLRGLMVGLQKYDQFSIFQMVKYQQTVSNGNNK